MPPRKPPVDHIDGYTPERLASTDPATDPVVQAAVKRESSNRKGKADRWLHLDGFANQLTGLGAWETDKVYGGKQQGPDFRVDFLTGPECSDRWRGSDLGGRIVEQIPMEMTREGWEMTVQPEDDEEFKIDGKTRARADSIAIERTIVEEIVQARAGRNARETREIIKRFRAHCRKRRDAAQSVAPAGLAGAPGVQPEITDDDIGQAIVEEMEARDRDLGVADAAREGLNYERAYGGGGVLLGVDDGETDLTKPLDETRIKSIRHLTAFRGGWDGELIAWRYYNDPRLPKFGQPEIYMLRNLGVPISSTPAPGETVKPQVMATSAVSALICFVHESRLLLFGGTPVSRQARVQMRGWGDSVFTRVGEVLSQYSQTWSAVANLMTDWAQGVLKMEGLADLIAGPNGETTPGGGGVVAARMMAINMGKSIARTYLIDSEEEFKREVAPLTGIADVLGEFALRLAAAADMPVSMLMGQVKGGLGDAGNTDLRFFYDRVAGLQEMRLMPQIRRLKRLQFLAKDSPTGGVEPKKWAVTPRTLWQPTAGEETEQRNKQAQTDQIYINAGVVTAQEVAASRFGGAKYSTETVIDMEARRAMARLPATEEGEGDPNAAPAPGQAPGDTPPPAAAGASVDLTATAISGIITVNEARAVKGLPPWPGGADGELTVAEFMAKRAAVIATAANAEAGTVGKPPDADKPDPVPVIAHPPGAPGAPPGKAPTPPKEGDTDQPPPLQEPPKE